MNWTWLGAVDFEGKDEMNIDASATKQYLQAPQRSTDI